MPLFKENRFIFVAGNVNSGHAERSSSGNEGMGQGVEKADEEKATGELEAHETVVKEVMDLKLENLKKELDPSRYQVFLALTQIPVSFAAKELPAGIDFSEDQPDYYSEIYLAMEDNVDDPAFMAPFEVFGFDEKEVLDDFPTVLSAGMVLALEEQMRGFKEYMIAQNLEIDVNVPYSFAFDGYNVELKLGGNQWQEYLNSKNLEAVNPEGTVEDGAGGVEEAEEASEKQQAMEVFGFDEEQYARWQALMEMPQGLQRSFILSAAQETKEDGTEMTEEEAFAKVAKKENIGGMLWAGLFGIAGFGGVMAMITSLVQRVFPDEKGAQMVAKLQDGVDKIKNLDKDIGGLGMIEELSKDADAPLGPDKFEKFKIDEENMIEVGGVVVADVFVGKPVKLDFSGANVSEEGVVVLNSKYQKFDGKYDPGKSGEMSSQKTFYKGDVIVVEGGLKSTQVLPSGTKVTLMA